jgi:sec-independent protein translocase protein TatB
MSFSDTVFLFFLALILFGPKKLPGMARQAGRLLAELRRASNEFKSQIETEIAHLETEKTQTILPPSASPQGTVASLTSSPVLSDPVPLQLESPIDAHTATDQTASADSTLAGPTSSTPSSSTPSSSTPPAEAVADPDPSPAQESHA